MKPDQAITLVPVDRGKLALTHRPKKTVFPAFRALGVTHVITLLDEKEGAKDLGALATQAGLTWIWCPLQGANVNAPLEAVASALAAGTAALARGGAIAVHCSAGIHRTGMFGYALLRCAGLDPEAARVTLRALRVVTAEGVGAERLTWGDQIADAFAARAVQSRYTSAP
jgi:protein-tyrosine phosphatase